MGAGFTDSKVPDYISDALAVTAKSTDCMLHQYTRGFGHPRLVQALSKLYSTLIYRPIEPFSEVLVTCGAYEALYVAIQGYVQ